MTVHEEKAAELFRQGYNCAQAVLAAFAPEVGMEEAAALRLASSFGGGIGGMRNICGALSGMLMAAGLLFGYDEAEAKEEKAAHYERVQQLTEAFRRENGSILCRELLGLDADTKPIPPAARTAAYYDSRPCPQIVANAARILDEYLEQHKNQTL